MYARYRPRSTGVGDAAKRGNNVTLAQIDFANGRWQFAGPCIYDGLGLFLN